MVLLALESLLRLFFFLGLAFFISEKHSGSSWSYVIDFKHISWLSRN
jgi:hypothetical protein